jgi:hypothetical protein
MVDGSGKVAAVGSGSDLVLLEILEARRFGKR